MLDMSVRTCQIMICVIAIASNSQFDKDYTRHKAPVFSSLHFVAPTQVEQ